jgi:hypothetical protein
MPQWTSCLMHTRTHLVITTLLTLPVLLGGCASNVWEETFVAVAPVREVERPAPAAVTVREVPWSRLEAALAELETEIVASDIHPDEWPPERTREADATLLLAMQFSEPTDDLVILGRSDFSSTDAIDPRDGSLAEFAAQIGADYAVWSRTYRGKTDHVVTEPVTTYTDETLRFRGRDGKRRTETVSGSATTYVPLVVARDEWAWVAFFVRKEDK